MKSEKQRLATKAWKSKNKDKVKNASRAWYARNKERVNSVLRSRAKTKREEYIAKWQKDHPGKRARSWKKWSEKPEVKLRRKEYAKLYDVQRNYGLKPEDYLKLERDQNGKCAICFGPPVSGKSLSVDHCHTTHRVRGLLCQTCNLMIGYSKDNPILLEEAARYLKKSHD